VVAVVSDLFFSTRISATAERAGVALEVSALDQALESILRAPPDLVILDLHVPGDPLALVRALRSEPATRSIPLVGFYSHVDHGLRTAALAAGVNPVMPRSAFTVRLPSLLAGEGDTGGRAGLLDCASAHPHPSTEDTDP